MKFYSTNGKSEKVGFKEAVIKSLPSDGGLYFPEKIPHNPNLLEANSLPEMAEEILAPFCKEDLDSDTLHQILTDAINFDIPHFEVEKNLFSLELFHGPTYAFKDVGARFLARCLGHFNRSENRKTTILVATSGDTGGAVASGFYQVSGVEVIILYPSGKVSDLQEKQLTTLGENITALEINGTFDDCQRLVKNAFLDPDLTAIRKLTSANSINIARWLPQSVYYFWACKQFRSQELVISVPSGNYGNLAAGILAKRMGAPIKQFIASSNANDVVPRFLSSKRYEPQPTIATYSNAMDVGDPSNFPRLLELYEHDYAQMTSDVTGGSLSDEKTLETITACWQKNKYLLDPHGAIGYQLLKQSIQPNEIGVFLETAHPCKFLPVIKKVLPDYQLPIFAQKLEGKIKRAVKLESDYCGFKDYLLA